MFFDTDRSGSISEASWMKGLQKLGQDALSRDEIIEVFTYLDTDQTGYISVEQFKEISNQEKPHNNIEHNNT